MKKATMIFTESITITVTNDKVVTTMTKSLESLNESGVRCLRGHTCIRRVEDITLNQEDPKSGKAA